MSSNSLNSAAVHPILDQLQERFLCGSPSGDDDGDRTLCSVTPNVATPLSTGSLALRKWMGAWRGPTSEGVCPEHPCVKGAKSALLSVLSLPGRAEAARQRRAAACLRRVQACTTATRDGAMGRQVMRPGKLFVAQFGLPLSSAE
jgi:hypothetical protein